MATIYIVEDDINIREIERYALKNSGYTVEEFDPDPYMDALNKWGLPWQIEDKPVLVD